MISRVLQGEPALFWRSLLQLWVEPIGVDFWINVPLRVLFRSFLPLCVWREALVWEEWHLIGKEALFESFGNSQIVVCFSIGASSVKARGVSIAGGCVLVVYSRREFTSPVQCMFVTDSILGSTFIVLSGGKKKEKKKQQQQQSTVEGVQTSCRLCPGIHYGILAPAAPTRFCYLLWTQR